MTQMTLDQWHDHQGRIERQLRHLQEGDSWTLCGDHPRFAGKVRAVFTITEVPCPVADRVPGRIIMRLTFEDVQAAGWKCRTSGRLENPTHLSLRLMRVRWEELVQMGFIRD
tara:strand:+ start:500 stop:835 length:336 start_codon:yes stop_codon:yes gene_type:complete